MMKKTTARLQQLIPIIWLRSTTSLNGVLVRLTLFISENYVSVMMAEEFVHVMILITKYHAKAEEYFFKYFVQFFILI